ncbi:hypothetical protein KSP39_PZI002864 [Platanthera zijinensis]|uniref:CCHC-type domain-containing protein n=1 Tax=Platanthera zijinensis TaxID=2320716 RepID=A0AAP0BZN9_9ASPA
MEAGLASNLDIYLLTQTNFKKWMSCVESFLLGEDLWEVVCGAERQRFTTVTGNAEALRVWEERNANTEKILKQLISSELLDYIDGCQSAAEIWTSLIGLFNKEGKVAAEDGPSTSYQQERRDSPRRDGKKKEGPRCYKCKQLGHIRKECKVILHSANVALSGSKGENLVETSTSSDRINVIDSAAIWHERLGHVRMDKLKAMTVRSLVGGLPNLLSFKDGHSCTECQLGEADRFKVDKAQTSCKRPLEIIHGRLLGPTVTASLGGSRYMLLLVDDYTRYTWVYFMKEKSNMFRLFVEFKNLVEGQLGLRIKKLVQESEVILVLLSSLMSAESMASRESSLVNTLRNKVVLQIR